MKVVRVKMLNGTGVRTVTEARARRLEAEGRAVRVEPPIQKTKPITEKHSVTKG